MVKDLAKLLFEISFWWILMAALTGGTPWHFPQGGEPLIDFLKARN